VGITDVSPGVSNTSPCGLLVDSNQARKEDSGKLRFELLPVRPLQQVVDVYTMGARKYTDRNWEKGLRWGRVFGAMMRHAWAWWGGEERDKENGQKHLASVVWAALALMEYEETHRELDDRPATQCVSGPQLSTGYRSWKELERDSELSREAVKTNPYRDNLKIMRQADIAGYKEVRS
jgi:hypothetical protein